MTDKEKVGFLVDKFQDYFNLGVGNNYTEEILNQKLSEFESYVKEYYPLFNSAYLQIRDLLLQALKERYSGKSDAERNAEKHSEGGESTLDDFMKLISNEGESSDEKKTTTETPVTRNLNDARA